MGKGHAGIVGAGNLNSAICDTVTIDDGGILEGPYGRSASRFKQDVEKIGSVNTDGHTCSIDGRAGCTPFLAPEEQPTTSEQTESDYPGASAGNIHGDRGRKENPFDEVSEHVGPEGTTINIGGCSVTFPSGCFEKTQKVTVSASINMDTSTDRSPHGKVGITPTLHVEAHDLKVPAIVKMKTWCVDDGHDNGNIPVEVLRFDEGAEDWDIVHSCQLGRSREIEFQVSHFCDILGCIKHCFAPAEVVRPIVCFYEDQFAIAIVLDEERVEENCVRDMKRILGQGAEVKRYNRFDNKYLTKIECRIFSEDGEFTFTPPVVVKKGKRVSQAHGSCISTLTVESEKGPGRVTLKFQLHLDGKKREDNGFKYFWQPVEQRPTSEQTESSSPRAPRGNLHAGPATQRNVIGTQNNGNMTVYRANGIEATSG